MWRVLLITTLLATVRCKQLPQSKELQTTTEVTTEDDATSWPAQAPIDDFTVACERDSMHITVSLAHVDRKFDENNDLFDTFNGIVYPAGLGSNSSCLREYEHARGELKYTLPLMGCNTMAKDNDDGTVEYHNMIIVQPHPKIVTGQGRGYEVRCRYRRRDLMQFHVLRQNRAGKALADLDSDLQDLEKEFVMLPSVTMQLFKGDPEDKHEVSEAKVGDTVTLVVSLEKQDNVGMLVRDCYVHDALGWAEHKLIDEDGCPLDSAVMGVFQYSADNMRAQVSFSAHKFAWSPSVYYTCGVKLCKKACQRKSCADKSRRPRRDLDEGSPATVEVFTGLYVNEADSLESDEVTSEKKEDEICISQRNFAIGICIAGVILMICVIAAIAYILARRRSPKTYSRTGSSLYSGPYTNTGYSHTS
ncbi:cuticlin-1 [Ostrinia furnacalis]|uniref:cuticlin-1 n=1 Tax=Ostrinia furnacalis TaxID=93504 RepID=UPI00103F8D41|nr:cuticlin-1 [Ostrinia furnacalis]